MVRLLSVLVLAVAAGACGGARGTSSSPPDTHVLPPPPDPASDGTGVARAGDDRPTERECDTLIAHVVALELAERPEDQRLADAEQAQLREQLRAQHLAGCRELSRASYRCLLAATQTAALRACP